MWPRRSPISGSGSSRPRGPPSCRSHGRRRRRRRDHLARRFGGWLGPRLRRDFGSSCAAATPDWRRGAGVAALVSTGYAAAASRIVDRSVRRNGDGILRSWSSSLATRSWPRCSGWRCRRSDAVRVSSQSTTASRSASCNFARRARSSAEPPSTLRCHRTIRPWLSRSSSRRHGGSWSRSRSGCSVCARRPSPRDAAAHAPRVAHPAVGGPDGLVIGVSFALTRTARRPSE